MQLEIWLQSFNILLHFGNNPCSIAVEHLIFHKIKVCRLYYFNSILVISILMKSRLFGGRAPRIKLLLDYFQVIKPQMSESKPRKNMLIPIIGPIYFRFICLYAQHLDLYFQITLPYCGQLILLCIRFIDTHLNNIEVFEN